MTYYEVQTVECAGVPRTEYRYEPEIGEEISITIEFLPFGGIVVPLFGFGDGIDLDGDIFNIIAMEWTASGWRYGIRSDKGTRETIWFEETELVRVESREF